jgi:hypothetical protein
MFVRTIAPALLPALAVLACATHTERTVDFDPAVDFSAVKRLAFFYDTEAGAAFAPGMHSDDTRSAIKRELIASGHSFVPPAQADLLVVYHVGARADPHTTHMIAGETGTEGEMVISFRDPESQRTLWWGSAQLMIDKNSQPKREIDRLVKALLSEFPPPPGASSDYPLQ